MFTKTFFWPHIQDTTAVHNNSAGCGTVLNFIAFVVDIFCVSVLSLVLRVRYKVGYLVSAYKPRRHIT